MEASQSAQEILLSEIGTWWFSAFWILLLLFGAAEWLTTASGADPFRSRRWPTNLILGGFNILLASLMPVSSLVAALAAQSAGFGILNATVGQGWIAFFATILLRSLAGYFFHLATHRMPFLWRMHRVHHSDTHLDVTTAVRAHPFELILLTFTMASIAALSGFSPWGVIAYEIMESMNTLLTHAHFRLPPALDRALRFVFVTPNMHELHHSARQPETDSNYGGVFSFWDRLFRTYSTEPHGSLRYGLDEFPRERAASLWWQVKMPLVSLRQKNRGKPEE